MVFMSKKGNVMGYLFWFFSNLVGEEDSRIPGVKGARGQGFFLKIFQRNKKGVVKLNNSLFLPHFYHNYRIRNPYPL